MPPFTYAAFQAHICAEFWEALSKRKLDVRRTSDAADTIFGLYESATKSSPAGAHCRLDLCSDALEEEEESDEEEAKQLERQKAPKVRKVQEGQGEFDSRGCCIASGTVYNTNTLEDFQHMDKNQFLRDRARTVWEAIESGAAFDEPSLLVSFSLLCFADLKKYVYLHWMCYPAFPIAAEYGEKQLLEPQMEEELHDAIMKWRRETDSSQWGFFVFDKKHGVVHTLARWKSVAEANRIFAFVDPSANDAALGWPVRNLLCALLKHLERFDLLSCSRRRRPVLYKDCRGQRPSQMPMKATGWERNTVGELRPRVYNLAAVLDPKKLADDAVHLNLKLMKWRAAPELDLDRVRQTKCLLLGAGTLGCYVARGLLGWGFEHVTFVDSGRVSFSNPVRQPLFRFEDCVNQGRNKAEAAAAALKEIVPGVTARGIPLSVPMIGHPYERDDESGAQDYKQLEDEIDSHEVIFLLMDSRESRWLPTVMGAAKGKIVINAALGFDNFVVLRHGVPSSQPARPQLGCYFCNDVVVPKDSTSNRTLDQQCTVTRPGLAPMASAMAVELLVSILQHPLGAHCPAPSKLDNAANETILGSVPHIIRGYLRSWENKILTGKAYPGCSACSPPVIQGIQEGGWAFVEQAINEPGFIDQVCGLSEVQAGVEGVDIDWDESDSDSNGQEDDFLHV